MILCKRLFSRVSYVILKFSKRIKTDLLKKFAKSATWIFGALAVILGIITALYAFCLPGSGEPLPEYKNNAIRLGRSWTGELAGATRSGGCELLLGIPAYDDAGTIYHYPQVENISSALKGFLRLPVKRKSAGLPLTVSGKWMKRNGQSGANSFWKIEF